MGSIARIFAWRWIRMYDNSGKRIQQFIRIVIFHVYPYSLGTSRSTILKIIQGIRNTQSYLRPSYPQRREYTSCEANEIV